MDYLWYALIFFIGHGSGWYLGYRYGRKVQDIGESFIHKL
jgi:hypothetical protein